MRHKPSRSLFSILTLLCLSLTGCGYHFGTGGVIQSYRTISVPYVEGDWDGTITTTIVKQLTQYGRLVYRDRGGSLILKVRIIDFYDDNIGFRYDIKKSGKPRKALIPDETRTTVVAEVTVVEAASGCVLLGPVQLSAETEYDHDYYSNRDAINVFSLGQLTDIDEAYDAAQKPLNQRLAEKIVDYVNDKW